MKIVALLDSDKKEIRRFAPTDSMNPFFYAIQRNDVDIIVVGEIVDGKVVMEKQFSAITVLPATFGET